MNKNICYVVSIKAKPAWLTLTREKRDGHWQKVADIIQEFLDKVTFQYYDADAFHAGHSDLVICETDSIIDYHHLWDRIKDTEIFSAGYYEITDVRMGIKGVSHG